MSTPCALSVFNAYTNEQLLEYVRSNCRDPHAADLLKQRWMEFWEKDHKKLRELSDTISRLRERMVDPDEQRVEADGLQKQINEREDEIQSLRDLISREDRDFEKENKRLAARIVNLESQLSRLIPYVQRPALRDHVQIIPSFQIYDDENGHHAKPTEIARMARVLS